MQEVLGFVPEPEIITGHHLLQVLFAVGPAHVEAPLSEADLEPWERRRGIELEPWEAECIVAMSKAYMHESYLARDWNYLSPWPRGQNAWQHCRAVIDQRRLDEALAQPLKDGHRGKKQRQGPR